MGTGTDSESEDDQIYENAIIIGQAFSGTENTSFYDVQGTSIFPDHWQINSKID